MADDAAIDADTDGESHALREHLEREAYTMALYISIVLLAGLAALSDHEQPGGLNVIALVWGTTIGLALTHWFAFHLAARLTAGGSKRREDVEIAVAQMCGAAAIAALVTVPLLLLPATVERDVARLEIAFLISAIAYLVARADGARRIRALVYAGGMLIVAGLVAGLKNALAGH